MVRNYLLRAAGIILITSMSSISVFSASNPEKIKLVTSHVKGKNTIINIIDSNKKIVLSTTTKEDLVILSVKHLVPGNYSIEINNGSKKETKPLVID